MDYTLEQIDRAGNLLGEQLIPLLEAQIRAELAIWEGRELPPLTRLQRVQGRLHEYRYRVELAAEALRGRHDCDY